MPLSPSEAICQFIPPFMRYLREGLAEMNMSPARFQILEALYLEGAQTMIELANRLSVTKRNVTGLVDGLEKEGLAERQPHPTDRRSTLVALTAHGKDVFSQAAKVQRDHLNALIATLNPQRQVAMAAALSDLTQALAAKR